MYTIHRFKLICPDCETKIVKEAQKELAMVLIGDNLFYKKDYLSINVNDLKKYID